MIPFKFTFVRHSLRWPFKYLRTKRLHIMTSPPSTPSKLLPSDRSQWRFYPICTPTEWIEQYRPGKFHPIHLGDLLDNARYRVIRKLGYGSYSTVWLARDDK